MFLSQTLLRRVVVGLLAVLFRSQDKGAQQNWQSLELFHANVHEINSTTGQSVSHNTSVGLFDFSGPVELSIEPSRNAFPSIDTVRIRPLSYNLPADVQGRIISLSLTEPTNLVIEVNGDVFDVLHLFLDKIKDDAISEDQAKQDSSIIYYGPGYHELKDTVNITSGQTVYLAPGSVIQGGFRFQNTSDAAILGRGVLYRSSSDAITISYSERIRVEEITVLNPGHYSLMMGSSNEIVVSGLRSISAVQWGDGIDVFCCQNVVLEKLFMRNSDDCVAMYQHRWDYYGDSRNITLRDSSLWADVAHPIHLGIHGNTIEPELMEGVTISNIDILDHREPQVDYQGCLAINCGDENLIKDILFEDIRVEDFRLGMLFSFKVLYNQKYNLGPGRGIYNVTVRNLSYNGMGGQNTPAIAGYDEDRRIEFVDFQGLNINSAHIWDGMQKPGWYSVSDFVPMYIGSHVANLTWSA
ncbi:pectin lyase fold/virulence factor [Aspergillus cavernicola]|uniref:Pectin lyase fold/virulence factor n=1 Tax=Aspergillus cavernicola TaxID=176166 RepID=A0ABR4HGS9_9EURO